LAFAVAALWAVSASAAPVSVSVSFFHDQLAPHGRWVAAGSYGNCWAPSGVAAGWEPYVDGQWVYSDYGWTWASNDPWGDIPYHYGTWAYVDPYGWVWVPGTVWAPAWVTWAYTDDYVGWAPVPPTFALSATGYFGAPVVVTATRYVFVPTRQFVGVPVATVRVPAQQGVTILPHAVKTTRFDVSNGVVRVAGPPAARVERAVGHPIQRVATASLRAQPTTLAAAGMTKSRSIRVVAPEAERAKVAAAPAARPETRSAQAKPQKAQAETRQAQTRAEKAPKSEKQPARPASESNARNASASKAPRTRRSPSPRRVRRPKPARRTSRTRSRRPSRRRSRSRSRTVPSRIGRRRMRRRRRLRLETSSPKRVRRARLARRTPSTRSRRPRRSRGRSIRSRPRRRRRNPRVRTDD